MDSAESLPLPTLKTIPATIDDSIQIWQADTFDETAFQIHTSVLYGDSIEVSFASIPESKREILFGTTSTELAAGVTLWRQLSTGAGNNVITVVKGNQAISLAGEISAELLETLALETATETFNLTPTAVSVSGLDTATTNNPLFIILITSFALIATTARTKRQSMK